MTSIFELDTVASEFDRLYYLAVYPDVANAKVDPVVHYCSSGWREGRDPSASFDTQYYLRYNEDVADAGMNPFYHYLLAGRKEKRLPRPPDRSARQKLFDAKQPSSELYFNIGVDSKVAQPQDILSLLGRTSTLVVSVSHDDYAKSFGGVQLVVSDEAAGVRALGFDHLHLSPAEPRRTLAQPAEFYFSVRCNGEFCGIASSETVQEVLSSEKDQSVIWSIHHLMGHSPEAISRLCKTVKNRSRVFVWAHDFFAACTNFNLLRNDISFCGAPPISSQACVICVYGATRKEHVERIATFVKEVQAHILAPSDTALSLWSEYSKLPVSGSVLPIAELKFTSPRQKARSARVVRVAFLGARVFQKGWHAFAELAMQLNDDPRYEFMQLGANAGEPCPTIIQNAEVFVTAEQRHAMVDALAQYEVDVVLSWSIWPETFNLTIHEAMAAGALVVVRRNIGHPWTAARRLAPDSMIAVEDANSLLALFRSDGIIGAVEKMPKRAGTLLPGRGVASLLASGMIS